MSGMRAADDRSLSDLEHDVQVGLDGYAKAGAALTEIRDRMLYVEAYGTFDRYCRDRWGFNRQRAHQLMQAARVSNMLDAPPANARQAAELVTLLGQPKKLQSAWAEAQTKSTGTPTAKDVAAAVAKRAPKPVLVKATEYAAAHPKATPSMIARQCNVSKAIAEEARRRHPVAPGERRSKVVDIAGRRAGKGAWAVWPLVALTLPAEDEMVRWAAAVPEGDVVAALERLGDVMQAAQRATEVLIKHRASTQHPSA